MKPYFARPREELMSIKTDLEAAEQRAKAAAIAKVNAETSWVKANAHWLIAVAAAFIAGFILAHV